MTCIETPDDGHGWLLYTHPATTLLQIDPFVGNDTECVYGPMLGISRVLRYRIGYPLWQWCEVIADRVDRWNEPAAQDGGGKGSK